MICVHNYWVNIVSKYPKWWFENIWIILIAYVIATKPIQMFAIHFETLFSCDHQKLLHFIFHFDIWTISENPNIRRKCRQIQSDYNWKEIAHLDFSVICSILCLSLIIWMMYEFDFP